MNIITKTLFSLLCFVFVAYGATESAEEEESNSPKRRRVGEYVSLKVNMELAHRGLFNVEIAPGDKRVDEEDVKIIAKSLQNVAAYRWTLKGDCADALIKVLTQMSNKALAVKSIDLSEFSVSSKFLETFLAKAQGLEQLRGSEWFPGRTSLEEWVNMIAGNKNFKYLEFSCCSFPPEELARLSALPLISLDLDHFQHLTQNHILVLGGLRSLQNLDIYDFSESSPEEADAILCQIAKSLPYLKRLLIGEAEVTSVGIKALATMKDLKQLNIKTISEEDKSILTGKFPGIKISDAFVLDDPESDAD